MKTEQALEKLQAVFMATERALLNGPERDAVRQSYVKLRDEISPPKPVEQPAKPKRD